MPELTGQMLHFAYGEDLSPDEFTRICSGADWFGPARLEGYRLTVGAGGRFNVVPAENGVVWGGLWLVPARALPEFDAQVADGYERTTRKIISPAGPRIEATLYMSADRVETPASTKQICEIVAAAKACRLPASYVLELEAKGALSKTAKDSR